MIFFLIESTSFSSTTSGEVMDDGGVVVHVLGLNWLVCFVVVVASQAAITHRLKRTTLLETVVGFPSMFLAVLHQLLDDGESTPAELTVIQSGGGVLIVECSLVFVKFGFLVEIIGVDFLLIWVIFHL